MKELMNYIIVFAALAAIGIIYGIYRLILSFFKRRAESLVRSEMDYDIRKAKDALTKAEATISDAHATADAILSDAHAAYDKIFHAAEKVCSEGLRAAPFLASMFADILQLRDEAAAIALETKSRPAFKAAETVRAYAKENRSLRQSLKLLEYHLSVYEALLPFLSDLEDASTAELSSLSNTPDDAASALDDPVRSYLSEDEYRLLSDAQRNQLALDRYNKSHHKSNWQVGRDYEMYIAHIYRKKGYRVEPTGSLLRYDDLGRDIIAHKGNVTLIIQCKYWSQQKTIHEKHIFQLFGTSTLYQLDHPEREAHCILVTNTDYSDRAKSFARQMGVNLISTFPMGEYPQIKCNLSNSGERIYHLPMDQQYDNVKIDQPGEFYASTVKEAEAKGFRRAFKWRGE